MNWRRTFIRSEICDRMLFSVGNIFWPIGYWRAKSNNTI
jgi:hypothetical protein